MSTRKRTSPVWEYSDAPVVIKENGKDVVKVRCKLCGMLLVHGGSTTILASYLSAKHMEEYTHSFGGPASTKKHMTVPTIVRKCSAECTVAITRLITEFVARDLR